MLEMQIGLSHYRFGIACICYQYANIQNTVANNGNILFDNGTQKLGMSFKMQSMHYMIMHTIILVYEILIIWYLYQF